MPWPRWPSLQAHFEPPPVADPLWRRALAGCALARRLDPDRQLQLRRLTAWFLARKQFHALAGVVLDDYWRVLIAVQACLPALQQGTGSLRGWRDVLVYPGEFRLGRSHQDSHLGAVSECARLLGGDTGVHGPLVLSLADVQMDLEQPWDGYNVVLHEMAHKLDMLDGPADGIPPLVEISRRRWIEQFQLAYQRLLDAPAHGGDCPIDRYAAHGLCEYFAVVSELHYSQPATLRQAEPAIAGLLTTFYGRSPADGGEPGRGR